MYLPLMAVLAGLVICIYRLNAQQQRVPRSLATVLLVIAVVALGTMTILRNREYQSWLTLAQKTLERWPTDVAHGGVGSELARLRRDAEALTHLRIAARSDARARYNLGITLYNLKRYDEAIRELDVLVGRYPNREEAPWSRRLMGFSHARMSRWPRRLPSCGSHSRCRRMTVKRDASSSTHTTAMGSSSRRLQKYYEAITQFRLGLSLDENNASLRYNLATALFDKGDIKESFDEAQRAVSLDPANADGYNLLGRLLAMQGQFKDALVNLEAAVKLRPNDPALGDDLRRLQKFLDRDLEIPDEKS